MFISICVVNASRHATSRQTNTGALALWDCVRRRTDGSDVITKPKFFAFMSFPNFLSYGAPRRRTKLREFRKRDFKYIIFAVKITHCYKPLDKGEVFNFATVLKKLQI